MSSKALLRAKSFSALSTNLKDAFFYPSLVDSKAVSNASKIEFPMAFRKGLSISSLQVRFALSCAICLSSARSWL